jgi:riboflavin kinase/FMN adenylyltransferase
VIQGDRRGRELGFPTANIAVHETMCMPADGVYAGWFVTESGDRYRAAINFGRRPTFVEHATHSLLEAHLLDFSGDLYGQRARVTFEYFLRSERKFDGLESLKRQLQDDVVAARSALA